MPISKMQSESVNLADDFAGMHFGGTATANTLSDYEEGSWTPSVSYGSGSSYTTISSPNVAVGAYRKIGSMLYISFYFYKNSFSSKKLNMFKYHYHTHRRQSQTMQTKLLNTSTTKKGVFSINVSPVFVLKSMFYCPSGLLY